MTPDDVHVLRELGRQVAEIAALPVQAEKIRLWRALNGLCPVPLESRDFQMAIDTGILLKRDNVRPTFVAVIARYSSM